MKIGNYTLSHNQIIGKAQLRQEEAERLKSEAFNRLLVESRFQRKALEKSYQKFMIRSLSAVAFLSFVIAVETLIVFTLVQKESAPQKTIKNMVTRSSD